jgi:hypothetical protein
MTLELLAVIVDFAVVAVAIIFVLQYPPDISVQFP